MTFDDIRKLATGSILFSLDRILAPRLIRVFYFLGLLGIILWAINHFFFSFGLGFAEGLWGVLEIAVFGLTGFVSLRILCEALLVFFKANERAADSAVAPRVSASLIEEVREAIEQLAEEDEPREPERTVPMAETSVMAKPKSRVTPRRTAKRTPPAGAK